MIAIYDPSFSMPLHIDGFAALHRLTARMASIVRLFSTTATRCGSLICAEPPPARCAPKSNRPWPKPTAGRAPNWSATRRRRICRHYRTASKVWRRRLSKAHVQSAAGLPPTSKRTRSGRNRVSPNSMAAPAASRLTYSVTITAPPAGARSMRASVRDNKRAEIRV